MASTETTATLFLVASVNHSDAFKAATAANNRPLTRSSKDRKMCLGGLTTEKCGQGDIRAVRHPRLVFFMVGNNR